MQIRPASTGSAAGSIALIAVLVAAAAAAFAYTAGWFTPSRITPHRLVASLAPPGGPALGFRRNHAKGICFTGSFESNGNGRALSTAQMMAAGSYPVTGRFNVATPDPKAEDSTARVRGLSLRVKTPDGQEWRSAMITAPFFPVGTVPAFYELQMASARKDDPDAMKNFAAAHPRLGAFGAWAGSAPFTGSYAEERYNGLNSFVFTDAAGQARAVRWSFVPAAAPVDVPAEELKKRDPDFLAKEITERVQKQPQRWKMTVTVANPGDPTADPSLVWPQDRSTIEVGTLVASAIEPEPDGPCRDINFDPTVLPHGMSVSDDPFPAARSAAYSVSFNRRTAEERDYPHTAGAKP
jgi:catalase